MVVRWGDYSAKIRTYGGCCPSLLGTMHEASWWCRRANCRTDRRVTNNPGGIICSSKRAPAPWNRSGPPAYLFVDQNEPICLFLCVAASTLSSALSSVVQELGIK